MTDQESRQQCSCDDCIGTRKALTLLDDIACSEALMGDEDIERLSDARDILAHYLGQTYNENDF